MRTNCTYKKNSISDEVRKWIKQHFNDQDIAVTLTFRPTEYQYKAGYSPNIIWFSSSIRSYLNRLNYKILGRRYKNGHRLKSVNTFELNGSEGIHCHMIIQRPNPVMSRIPSDNTVQEIENCWTSMKCSGYRRANRVDLIWDSDGWVDYLFKDTDIRTSEYLDVLNWNLTGYR